MGAGTAEGPTRADELKRIDDVRLMLAALRRQLFSCNDNIVLQELDTLLSVGEGRINREIARLKRLP